jgi:hypothetical protein
VTVRTVDGLALGVPGGACCRLRALLLLRLQTERLVLMLRQGEHLASFLLDDVPVLITNTVLLKSFEKCIVPMLATQNIVKLDNL